MSSLSTLRTTTRRFINETDSANSTVEDDEIDDYLNQALTYLGTRLEWSEQTSESSAVTDQAVYELPDNFIAIKDAYFNNVKIKVLERADLAFLNPNWQDDPSGLPQYAYKADVNVVGLYPAPSSDHNGESLQVQYIKIPEDLSDDADVPDVHAAMQICLPFYAAFLCDYKLGNDKKAEFHMKMFEAHFQTLKSKVQKYADELLRFRWAGDYR